jgi:HAE1 family hydrophobic/amphiphilic exporter-1
VLLRAEKLREYNISVAEVVDAVRGQNANAPVGACVGPLNDQSIRLVGRIESPAEFEQIVVRRRGNEVVRLGQLATIADGFAEMTASACATAIQRGLSVTRSRERSTVGGQRVRKLVETRSASCPKGTKLESRATAARTRRTT